MGRYLVRRLLQFIPTLFIVAFLVFLIVELVPGDPCALMLGMEASGTSLDECRRDIGLELPLPVRLVDWFTNAFRGDLGVSLFLRQPVTDALLERFPVTISMAALAMVVALGVGVPSGIIAAINQGRTTDWAAMVAALIVLSVPSFWLALNLIFLFGVTLRWLPVGGYVPFKEDPAEFFKHLLMPCVSLGLAYSAMIARMTRTSMLEVLRMDYVRTAQAKGLRQGVVILRHAFRNALIPIATVVGMSAGGLLGGSAVTETVYTLPGVGRLVVEAVSRRDYLVVQGGILAITVTYLIMNLLVDVLYVWIDPRIRYD